MNVDALFPQPSHCEAFKRSRERFVSEKPGCYVLATFSGVVLYIGLAKNLRRRVNQHLDSREKISPTTIGRAVVIH